MIPRYQRLLFWTLAIASFLLAAVLARGCEQANKRLSAMHDESPIAAPVDTPQQSVALAIANDTDGSIVVQQLMVALPEDPALRARALLEQLFAGYAKPESLHPLASVPAVADVFFVDLPVQTRVGTAQTAVVNLHAAFVDHHPSGIEVEDLTVRSIVGTLHFNFPQLEQVRFLVDGQTRDNLAGHTVLNRTYPAIDTVDHPLHVLSQNGTRE